MPSQIVALLALFILGFIMKGWDVGSQMNGKLTFNTLKNKTLKKIGKDSSIKPDQTVNKFKTRFYILRTLNGTAKKRELYES